MKYLEDTRSRHVGLVGKLEREYYRVSIEVKLSKWRIFGSLIGSRRKERADVDETVGNIVKKEVISNCVCQRLTSLMSKMDPITIIRGQTRKTKVKKKGQ